MVRPFPAIFGSRSERESTLFRSWVARFDSRRWDEVTPETAEESDYYGLRGRLTAVLAALFLLSSVSFAVEIYLFYGDNVVFRRTVDVNIIIFAASLSIALGVFLKAWWTRYLSYALLAFNVINMIICTQLRAESVGDAQGHNLFLWSMIVLLLLRDLPLCLYLTASRRARMTLEHHAYRPIRAVAAGPD